MADPDGNAYGPYDVEVPSSEAEAFTEEAWYRLHDEGGVISGGALTFSGLTAQLAPIFVLSHGSYLSRDTTWTDTSPATTGAQARRDLLVARRLLTVGEGDDATPGRTLLLVLRGTPADTPVDPDPDLVNDELLWSWQVPASGGTAVTDIKDLRRRRGPYGEMGAGGLLNSGRSTTAQNYSGTGTAVRLVNGLPTGAHLKTGRAYRVKSPLRAWGQSGAAGPPVVAAAIRLSLASAAATATDDIVASNTAPLPIIGTTYRFPLPLDDVFQVAAENDYILSTWFNRPIGSGTVTVGPTAKGDMILTIEDIGPALPNTPFPAAGS